MRRVVEVSHPRSIQDHRANLSEKRKKRVALIPKMRRIESLFPNTRGFRKFALRKNRNSSSQGQMNSSPRNEGSWHTRCVIFLEEFLTPVTVKFKKQFVNRRRQLDPW